MSTQDQRMRSNNAHECDPEILAKRIRLKTLRLIHRAGSSHIGAAFSMTDLLAVLYTKILRVDPDRPDCAERDRFILSKGHACVPLYVVLAERGFFPKEWLEGFYQDGARLAGHATHVGVPGVEVSTRSEEHTSELQSRSDLVCRLLLEKKKLNNAQPRHRDLASLVER